MKAKPSQLPGEVLLELNRRDEPLLLAANQGGAPAAYRVKRILVPIDFSDCARKALQYALPLAQEQKAAITLLYVVPRPTYMGGEEPLPDFPAIEAGMRASGRNELAALAAAVLGGKAASNIVIRAGLPAVEILDVAENLPADLIVIATHGRTGLKHVLLGSVAEQVVRRASCPVLVVREKEHDFVSHEAGSAA